MSGADLELLQSKCQAAGQQHLLEDWSSLNADEQRQLAADIQVGVANVLPQLVSAAVLQLSLCFAAGP